MSDPNYKPHNTALADPALDQLFRDARTHNGWLDRPVTDDQLRDVAGPLQVFATANEIVARSGRPRPYRPLVVAGADFLAVLSAVWAHPEGPAAAVRAFETMLRR